MSLVEQERHLSSFQHVEQFYRTIRTAIKCAAWVAVAWLGFGAVEKFAGESTDVSVALSLALSTLVDVKFVLTFTLAGFATIWAIAERNLRLRKVENMQSRIRELESAIDPNRSSSGLTAQGKTNPRDRGRP